MDTIEKLGLDPRSTELPPNGWETEITKPDIRKSDLYLMYHKYIYVKYSIDKHIFYIDRRVNINELRGGDIFPESKKLLIIDENSSIMLYLRLDESEFDKCMSDDSFMYSIEGYVNGSKHMSYKFKNDFSNISSNITQKTINVIQSISNLISEELDLNKKSPYIIAVSDVHGDPLLFLLPYFISKTITSLRLIEDRIEFNLLLSSTCVNCGDLIAQNAYRFLYRQPKKYTTPNETERSYSLNIEVDILFHNLILGLTFILIFQTILRNCSCYFIIGNHDSVILDDRFELEMDEFDKVNIFEEFRQDKLEEIGRMIKTHRFSSDEYLRSLRLAYNAIEILSIDDFDGKFRTARLRELLNIRVEITTKSPLRTYIFQHSLTKFPINYFSRIKDAVFNKTNEIFTYPFEFNDDIVPKLYNDIDLVLSKSELDKDFGDRIKRGERIILVLGHNPDQSLISFTTSYLDKSLNRIRRMTSSEKQLIRNDSLISNIHHMDISDPFSCIFSLDSECNSSINNWLRSLRTNPENKLPYIRGGNVISIYLLSILIIVFILIVFHSFITVNNPYTTNCIS